MKTLLLRLDATKKNYQELAKSTSAITPPLWMAMRAAELEVYGEQVTVIDGEVQPFDLDMARGYYKIEIFPSGNHPSAYIQQQEGIKEIATKLKEQCKDLIIWADLPHFDKYLSPAWQYFPMDKYRNHNWTCWPDYPRTPYGVVFSSWGCPFKCSFCTVNNFYRTGYQERSLKWVIRDIKTLVDDYNVKSIRFTDEMFCLWPERVEKLCDMIIAEGLNYLNMWAYARVTTIRREMLPKLRKAGFRWLGFGMESGNEKIRHDMFKGYLSNEGIKEIVDMVKDSGIYVGGAYIFGFPDDNNTTMRQTLDFAKELNCEQVNFYCFVPDTIIYTSNGIKKIQDMCIGDDVFSFSKMTKVINVMSRKVSENIIELKPRYLLPVLITAEHPILIAQLKRGSCNKKAIVKKIFFKEVKDVKIFDKNNPNKEYDAVVVPKDIFIRKDTYVDFSLFLKPSKNQKGYSSIIARKYLTPWKVTEELAELFGWYVAEGSLSSRKNSCLMFALSSEEIDNINRVRELVYKCFGFKTKVIPVPKEKCVRVMLVSKVLCRAFPVMFGHNALNKVVPNFITNAPNKIVKAFLKGYLNGDGTSYPNKLGQWSASTSSKKLAYQLVYLFLKIGLVVGITKCKAKQSRKKDGFVINSKESYKLYWTNKEHRYLEDDKFFYVPIKSVTVKKYTGLVYNLMTKDQTYAIPFIVHNCLMAYPGTPLYNQAKELGWVLPRNWSEYAQYSYDCFPLRTKHLSASEVLQFRDAAFYEYHKSSKYLDMMQKTFGDNTVEEIVDMTRITLKRRLLE